MLSCNGHILKHVKYIKDSFGKSQNFSKIFFAQILVFDNDHKGKTSSSNGLTLNLFFFFFFNIIFRIVRRASEQIYTRYQLYFARCNYYQIVNLTSVQSVKVVQKYLDSVLSNDRTSFICKKFLYPKLSLCFNPVLKKKTLQGVLCDWAFSHILLLKSMVSHHVFFFTAK